MSSFVLFFFLLTVSRSFRGRRNTTRGERGRFYLFGKISDFKIVTKNPTNR